VAAGYAALSLLLIGVGLLIVHPLDGSALVRWDERSVRWFADHRSSGLSSLSAFWSRSADAPTIVGVGVIVAIVLVLLRQRQLVPWLAVILAVELATFLTVSYAVDRERPTVEHLGSVPSTGSFPSGHIAATIVLYGFVALVLRRAGAGRARQVLAMVWTVVAAVAVGWARMYRGMHHPLDVLAGAGMGLGLLATFAWAMSARVDRISHAPGIRGPRSTDTPEVRS
jgi:membrane-associated phospholipid phosphatase